MFTVLIVLYNSVLMKRFEPSVFILTASAFKIISTLVLAYQVSALKINARVLLMIQATIIKSVVVAFLYFPATVFFTKMVPHQIETSMIGLSISIIKFNSEVLARLWGYFLNI
jgi:hypothetical protein